MTIQDTVAVITGATNPIGKRIAHEFARRGVHGLALVDSCDTVADIADQMNQVAGDWICAGYRGSITDELFRRQVFHQTAQRCGTVNVCVPAYGLADPCLTRTHALESLMSSVEWATEMVRGFGEAPSRHGSRLRFNSPRTRGMVFFLRLLPSLRRNGDSRDPVAEERFREATAALMARAGAAGVSCAVLLSDHPDTELIVPHAEHEEAQPSAVAKAICCLLSSAAR